MKFNILLHFVFKVWFEKEDCAQGHCNPFEISEIDAVNGLAYADAS